MAFAVWAAVAAVTARTQLRAVQSSLTTTLSSGGTNLTQVQALVADDLARAQDAQSDLDGLGPRLMSEVPLLGRNWTAERDVADPAVRTLGLAHALLPQVHGVADDGSIHLPALEAVHRQLAAAAPGLAAASATLDRVPTGWTLPGVAGNVATARSVFGQVSNGVSRGSSATSALGELFGATGPRTLLIGLENNGELRGTGGLVASYALAHADDGGLHIGRFVNVDSVANAPGYQHSVPAPSAYRDAYGPYLANTTIWKNVNMSPDAATSCAVLAEVAHASLGVQPDEVMLLDVPAAVGLLNATGQSVQLPNGQSASGPALTRDLLVQSYGSASLDAQLNNARHAALEAAASKAVATALHQPFGVPVVRALATAVDGGHLVLWSANGTTEAQLTAAGVSGAVVGTGHDVALVSANNMGDSPGYGNKLDTFARRSVSVTVAVGSTSAQVSELMTLHNDAPTGLGPYIAGPKHPGRLAELFGFAMGRRAHVTGVSIDGKAGGGKPTGLGSGQQLLVPLIVARGQTGTIQVSYTIPVDNGHYRLQLVPQALADPARLTVDVGAAQGDKLTSPAARFSGAWTSTKTVSVSVAG